jgi:hypothetical protein
MKFKFIIYLLTFIFVMSLANAQVTYSNCNLYGNCQPIQPQVSSVNYSSVNVNDSLYWQGHTGTDGSWLTGIAGGNSSWNETYANTKYDKTNYSNLAYVNQTNNFKANQTTNGSLLLTSPVATSVIYSPDSGKNLLFYDGSYPCLSVGQGAVCARGYETSVGNLISNAGYATTAVGHGQSVAYACSYWSGLGFQSGCTAGTQGTSIGETVITSASNAIAIGVEFTNSLPNTFLFNILGLNYLQLTNQTANFFALNINTSANVSASYYSGISMNLSGNITANVITTPGFKINNNINGSGNITSYSANTTYLTTNNLSVSGVVTQNLTIPTNIAICWGNCTKSYTKLNSSGVLITKVS